MKIRLRPHHLFCISQFKGAGYSDNFVKNMIEVIDNLKAAEIEIVDCADDICKACPNDDGGNCSVGEDDVKQRDLRVLEELNIELGAIDIKKIKNALLNIDKGDFLYCCDDCSWLDQGICDFDEFDFDKF